MAAADVRVVLIESERIGRGAAGSGAGWIADDPGVGFAGAESSRTEAGPPRLAGLAPRGPRLRGAHPAVEDLVGTTSIGRRRDDRGADASPQARNGKRGVKPGSTRRCSTPAWSAPKPASPLPASARATARRSIRIGLRSVWRGRVERGARMFERSPAMRIRFGRRTADIQTEGGTIRAERVVVATGLPTPLFKALRRHFWFRHRYACSPSRFRPRSGAGSAGAKRSCATRGAGPRRALGGRRAAARDGRGRRHCRRIGSATRRSFSAPVS